MVNNLAIALEAVTPMFLMIAVGYGTKLGKLIDTHGIKQINNVLFKAMFPCVAFYSLYGANIHEAFNPALICYSILMGILLWTLSFPVIMHIEKDRKKRGAMIQAINRSNFLVIGFPIVESICGKENLAATALTIVGMLLVNNIFAVVVLEIFRGGKPKILHILKEIIINPIIIATAAGTICMIFEVQFPFVIEKTISALGGTASNLALVVMGASLDLKNVGNRKHDLMICLIGKLIVVPGIVTVIGMLIGFRGVAFVTLLAFFAASPTVTSYTMADQMDSDGELARDSVVFATALVTFTMFCWIFLYKSIGMF